MPESHEPSDEELSEKLRRAFGDSADEGVEETPNFPKIDTSLPDTSDIDARLKSVASKASDYREKRTQTAEDLAKARKTEQADARGLGMGLQIAYTIVGIPLFGFLAGALVDHLTGTNMWKGFLGMGGCVLAIVVAIILINQANSRT